jgi:hypothetical protein
MPKRKKSAKKPASSARKPVSSARKPVSPASKRVPEEQLQGPPAWETVAEPSDRERAVEQERREYTSSGPALAGGDPDADWQRADSVGEEAPGGTVATPDQSVVDDLGTAVGVPREPDEEFRSSAEILEGRDRDRREQEE